MKLVYERIRNLKDAISSPNGGRVIKNFDELDYFACTEWHSIKSGERK